MSDPSSVHWFYRAVVFIWETQFGYKWLAVKAINMGLIHIEEWDCIPKNWLELAILNLIKGRRFHMQYSDELIKQELERYRIDQQPVDDAEVAGCKDGFVNLDEGEIWEALEYISGRSWYWHRLMFSADIFPDATVDEVMAPIDAIRIFHPEFEIGIQIAMRQLGKPIRDSSILRLEDSKIRIEPEPVKTKPKQKKLKAKLR